MTFYIVYEPTAICLPPVVKLLFEIKLFDLTQLGIDFVSIAPLVDALPLGQTIKASLCRSCVVS